MAKSVPLWSLIPVVLFTGLAGWAINSGVADPASKNVTIEFPGGGKINVASAQAGLDHETLLKQLFATDASRSSVLAWLRDNQHLYTLESSDLAEALSTKLCEPIPNAPLKEQLAKAQACAAKPVVGVLRRLAKERKTPFHYVGSKVSAGVQMESAHRPGQGRVNVCRTGEFVAQKLQVIDVVTDRTLEVQAGGTYECTFGTYPAIQLDPDDATTLFGRPTQKLEDVIVVVL